ncbi:GIY-YIG nuclease family protein [Microvirga sp. W0021]|uniref:GIY-YIG nuclease family protein n=1 Tax=Hohaiivirga grylli TaxID=3133970 RepID=A0ABV0BJK7_9HYPH
MENKNKSWWIYLVLCGDGTLYCGIARDVERRMADHATAKGSRYVRAHGGVDKVQWRYETISRSAAQRIEAWIKRLSRQEKINLSEGKVSIPAELEDELRDQ